MYSRYGPNHSLNWDLANMYTLMIFGSGRSFLSILGEKLVVTLFSRSKSFLQRFNAVNINILAPLPISPPSFPQNVSQYLLFVQTSIYAPEHIVLVFEKLTSTLGVEGWRQGGLKLDAHI